MPGNFKKDDLRVIKTYKSILTAFQNLLERRKFGHITVNDLCKEAQISRATFYAHYKDKYDLLKQWLDITKNEFDNKDKSYKSMERNINEYIRNNSKIIINLLSGANPETLALLHEFMISTLNMEEKSVGGSISSKYIILSNFCAGGMVNLLDWQIKNKFPPDLEMMNIYFYNILTLLLDWGYEYVN